MFMKKQVSVILTIVLCLTVLAACSQKTAEPAASNRNRSEAVQSNSIEKNHYPLTLSIYNNEGKEMQQTIEKEPQRVVVIGQGLAELMIHFGEEKRIAGLAYLDKSYSNYEKQIKQLPLLTDMWPSKESILALQPDLIVSMSSAFTNERLGDISFWNKRGIAVVTGINYTVGRTIDSFFEDIEKLGTALNIEEKTNIFVKDQKSRIESIRKKAAQATDKPRVLLFAGGQNDTYYYYGPTLCVIDEMIEGAGGEYIKVSKDTYVEMSAESILSVNPDKLVITEFQKSDSEAAKNKLLLNPVLRNVTAIKNKQVMVADYTNAIRGSLGLADLYEDVARFIHPELFRGEQT
ncbi:ABC transporter substrate-binding protein [Paenibacillus tyrfis]|uniref:ABC transporter substrate-binding protein n=1 Tax=Paenibacillus tyrfis TaxID=1501230 RepID=UPI0021654372|nr:ABC transporter substrate-binding protein [Paenibacillus tyrfis]